MWCEQCQSDVATEISADGQQLLCTTCSQPVRKVIAPSLHPETKSAREFLERWAREQQNLKASQEKAPQVPPADGNPLTTPASSLPPAESIAPKVEQTEAPPAIITPAPVVNPTPAPLPVVPPVQIPAVMQPPEPDEEDPGESETPAPVKKKLRLDSEHDAPSGPMPKHRDRPRRPRHLEKMEKGTAPVVDAPPASPPAPGPAIEKSREPRYRLDEPALTGAGPHFDVRSVQPQRTVYPGRSEAMWGQLLAYAGVGTLTVGTVFVLWGYFGEIETYASTGWLLSTAGQMLLLLGIVTLVGGGMQQTTHEVTQRIEHLGGRMIRIEESTDKILQAPYFRRSRRRAGKKTNGEQEAA